MEWLNNPWLVGIGGGILSGLIVTWLSRFILRKRDSREYRQKVASANRDVVYAVRPGISEGQMPAMQVLDALINATARRVEVESRDLFSPAQIAEELIKEVMDSSFISSTTKADYCAQLARLKESVNPPPLAETLKSRKEFASLTASQYRERYITMTSAMAGLLTAMMGIFTFVTFQRDLSDKAHIDRAFLSFVLPASVAIAGVMIPTMKLMLDRNRSRSESVERARKKVLLEPDDKLDNNRTSAL